MESRQRILRDNFLSMADQPAESAAISMLQIAMSPDGRTSNSAILIEPEQCDSFILALDEMRTALVMHRGNARARNDARPHHKAVGFP